MAKILWFARYELTDTQLKDLNRIYGEVEIVKFKGSVSSWREIVNAGINCDVLAVDLAPNLLADLVNPKNNQKPVIRAKMDYVSTGDMITDPITRMQRPEYHYEPTGWEQVLKYQYFNIVTKDL